MARKNIFDISAENETSLTDVNEASNLAAGPTDRPLAGLNRDRGSRPSALGAISQSLEKIHERSARADNIVKQLQQGETVIELDTSLIDGSIITDRLEYDDEEQSKLIAQIGETGQLVPILVRPHPNMEGRYQIAYGHRRVAAAKALNIKVKALVKELSDEELVIRQGQENNTRSDLSFIERAFFVNALDNSGFSRETIHASTGLDKAVVSKMTSIIKNVPETVLRAIGRAPAIGRPRWESFIEFIQNPNGLKIATEAATDPIMANYSSNERFQFVFEKLRELSRTPKLKADVIKPVLGQGTRPITIKRTGADTVFIVKEKIAPKFADYLQQRLNDIYEEFIEQQSSE